MQDITIAVAQLVLMHSRCLPDLLADLQINCFCLLPDVFVAGALQRVPPQHAAQILLHA